MTKTAAAANEVPVITAKDADVDELGNSLTHDHYIDFSEFENDAETPLAA